MADFSRHDGYVDSSYLDVAASRIRGIKQTSYARMHISAGHRVLDLGCGAGADTIELARLVGPAGSVVGVDHDPKMVAEAGRRAQAAGVSAWTSHLRADASRIASDADRFDASRSDRVFQHLKDPQSAFAELLRVTKPGGWIVVLEPDWSTSFVDADAYDVERRLTRFIGERQNNIYPGRRHYRRFKEHGLEDVTAEQFPSINLDYASFRYFRRLDQVERAAVAEGVITEEELQGWKSALAGASKAGTFFSGLSYFIVAGRKPGGKR